MRQQQLVRRSFSEICSYAIHKNCGVCVCERETVCVNVCEHVCVSVCVCETEKVCVSVCVREREAVCVCVCVCMGWRGWEGETILSRSDSIC